MFGGLHYFQTYSSHFVSLKTKKLTNTSFLSFEKRFLHLMASLNVSADRELANQITRFYYKGSQDRWKQIISSN